MYGKCLFFSRQIASENSWRRSDSTYRSKINFKRIPLKRTLQAQRKRECKCRVLFKIQLASSVQRSFTFPKGFHVVDLVVGIRIVQIVFPTIQLRRPDRSQLSVIVLMWNDNWFPFHCTYNIGGNYLPRKG